MTRPHVAPAGSCQTPQLGHRRTTRGAPLPPLRRACGPLLNTSRHPPRPPQSPPPALEWQQGPELGAVLAAGGHPFPKPLPSQGASQPAPWELGHHGRLPSSLGRPEPAHPPCGPQPGRCGLAPPQQRAPPTVASGRPSRLGEGTAPLPDSRANTTPCRVAWAPAGTTGGSPRKDCSHSRPTRQPLPPYRKGHRVQQGGSGFLWGSPSKMTATKNGQWPSARSVI